MNNEVIILIAEDDQGHSTLMKKNFVRAGLSNKILSFIDGQDILNFLLQKGSPPHRDPNASYLLILDIRMPKVDGILVLKQVKEHPELKKIPTIMVTTTDNPQEINQCYKLGCSTYIKKPIDYNQFIEAMQKLGMFIKIIETPKTIES